MPPLHVPIPTRSHLCLVALLLLCWSTATSCRRAAFIRLLQPPKSFAKARTPAPPNYALQQHWHVADRRFADKGIDVFFVHPTTYIRGNTWNQDLNDERTNARTQILVIAYQTSVFYASCNVFMPKYRQAVFPSFVDKKNNGQQALDLAYEDVRAAFDYYWHNHNRGRPFFIASHSQGSLHSRRLIAELSQDTAFRNQLIAAYLVGWPIEQAYAHQQANLPVCTTATQTGCLLSWNSQSPTAPGSMSEALALSGAMICVNPLSWSTDTAYQPPTTNRGALLNNGEGTPELSLHYCGAQVESSVLEVALASDARKLQTPLGKGNYHLYDYSFFYQNIRDNIAVRIEAFEAAERDRTRPARQ